MIKVVNEIIVSEVDGREIRPGDWPRVELCSHWSRKGLVVLTIANTRYTISGQDLAAALNNALNTARE